MYNAKLLYCVAKKCLERMTNDPITFTNQLLATQYSNLALYMFYTGDNNYTEEIETYLHQAYEIRKNFPEDIDSYCESCNNLSMFYETIDITKARMYMDESLQLANRYYSIDSEKLIDIYIQNCSLLTVEKRYDEAHNFFQLAYNVCKKIYGQDSIPYARITICESHTYKIENNDNKIISILPRAINIYKSHNIENEDLVVAYKYYLQSLVKTNTAFETTKDVICDFHNLLLRLDNDYYVEDLNVVFESAKKYNLDLRFT